MGVDKALLQLRGRPLIEYVSSSLSPLFRETLIVTPDPKREYMRFGDRFVKDMKRGPLEAIYLAVQNSGSDRVFVVGSDMPFVNPAVVQHMLGLSGDVVMPRHENGMFEPLHAIYSKNTLLEIEKSMRFGRKDSVSFLRNMVDVNYVPVAELKSYDPQLLTFFNVNSKDDLREAEEIDKGRM
jgi:molybdopterin-guanine dinucleotide biosynthesis protein A